MQKQVLVTGANRGIGLEFVKQARDAGWAVVATARDVPAATELNALGATVESLDVGSAESVARFAETTQDKAFDLVIHNAGVYGPRVEQSVETMDFAAWQDVLNVNTLGAFRVAQIVKPALLEGTGRTFVSLSSKMGSIADTSGGYYAYRTSKAALNAAMASLAQDWRPDGITVAALHPGWVRTDMGGPSAILDVEESVAGMLRVIEELTPERSGGFYNYDGSTIPW